MIDNYKIGNRIALLRREKGLTGESFAENNHKEIWKERHRASPIQFCTPIYRLYSANI